MPGVQSSEFSGPRRRNTAVAALAIFLVAAGLRAARSNDDYFTSDVADYVRAARVGIWNLYTDAWSTPVTALLARWKDPEFRRHPADALYRAEDNMAIRHFHGPGSFYVLAAMHDVGLNEKQQRMVWGVIGALTCGLLVWLLGRLGVWLPLAAAAGLLGAVSNLVIVSDLDPSPPHTLYLALVMIVFTLAVAAFERGFRQVMLYTAAAVLAFATITFELAVAVGAAAACGLAWAVWRRGSIRDLAGTVMRFAAVYAVSLGIFWFGGIARGLLAFSIVGNLGILKRGDYANESAFLSTLAELFGNYVTAGLLAVLLAAALARVRAAKPRPLGGVYVTFACYAAAVAWFAFSSRLHNVPYCAELLFPALLVIAVAVHLATPRTGRWLPMATAVVLVAAAVANLATVPRRDPDPTRRIVADIAKTTVPGDGVILVNDINIADALRLYLPRYEFEMTTAFGSITPRRAETAPRLCAAVLNAHGFSDEVRQNAAARFPALMTYEANGNTIWLGKRAN